MASWEFRAGLALILAASLVLAFGAPVDISNTGSNSINPRVYVDSNGVVHAVWQECVFPQPRPSPTETPATTTTPTPTPTPTPSQSVTPSPTPPPAGEPEPPLADCPSGRNWEILYTNNFGGSWNAPIDISNTTNDSIQPRIVVDSQGVVYVVWAEQVHGQAWQYTPWFSRSINRGRTWDAAAQATDVGLASTVAGGMPSIYYELAIDKNGQPGLAFVDGATMASFMEYVGVPQPWAAPRWLDNAAGGNHPRLAPSKNGGFHVVWDRGMEIWYARSTGGNLVDVSNTIGGSEKPDVDADSLDVAHVAWREANGTSGSLPAQWDVWYANVKNGAAHNSQDISNTPDQDSNWPRIEVDASDKLHVAWMDGAPGNYEILYSGSNDGGVSFSNWTDISNTTGFSYLPAIRADGNGYLHVLWGDDTPGNSEIYWNGWNSSWRGARDVSNTNSNSYSHDFMLDGRNRVHAVFEDNFQGNYDIYYLQDNGFGPNATRALKISVAGNCTQEGINLSVEDQSGNPIPGAGVGVFIYNTSLNWDLVANLTGDANGRANFTPSSAGSYKAVADKSGYPQQVKFFSIGACAQPSPTPAVSPSPGVSPTPAASPTASPMGSPTPGGNATATPAPTSTPVPTLTPAPTAAATATPAPTATATPGQGGGICPTGFALLFAGIGAAWVAKK